MKGRTEMPDTQSYTCRCCGATVAIDSTQCEYCSNPVRITTFRSIWRLTDATAHKYLSSYREASASGANSDAAASLAYCYLKLRLYDKARHQFEAAMAIDLNNSEVLFYAAICCLKGRKAFLSPRADIDKAIEYVEAARAIEPRPIYDYLLAYIKQDFFGRKGYRISPDFRAELASSQAKGLGQGDVAHLFEVLAVPCPIAITV